MFDPASNAMPSMLSDTSAHALHDIHDNIILAREFTVGLTAKTFAASRLHFYATTRALEIISEATRRLPDWLLEKYPELPWRAIRDAGNFYRHRYDNVAESYVWTTVRDFLMPLLEMTTIELANLDEPDVV